MVLPSGYLVLCQWCSEMLAWTIQILLILISVKLIMISSLGLNYCPKFFIEFLPMTHWIFKKFPDVLGKHKLILQLCDSSDGSCLTMPHASLLSSVFQAACSPGHWNVLVLFYWIRALGSGTLAILLVFLPLSFKNKTFFFLKQNKSWPWFPNHSIGVFRKPLCFWMRWC